VRRKRRCSPAGESPARGIGLFHPVAVAGSGNGPGSAGPDGGGSAALGRAFCGSLGRVRDSVDRRVAARGADSGGATALRPLRPIRRVTRTNGAKPAFHHGLHRLHQSINGASSFEHDESGEQSGTAFTKADPIGAHGYILP
jgi:hypothetical protein